MRELLLLPPCSCARKPRVAIDTRRTEVTAKECTPPLIGRQQRFEVTTITTNTEDEEEDEPMMIWLEHTLH